MGTRRRLYSPGSVALALVGISLFTILLLAALRAGPGPARDERVLRRSTEPSPDETCRHVHYVEDQCAFITNQCPGEDGSIFYLDLFYCKLATTKALGLGLLVAWLCLLFLTISIAASDFFCPNLDVISRMMGVSETIAGVTFLAFANGAPDLFSTFAAFTSNSGSLAIGELFGAACFITTIVAGSMAIVRPFRVDKKPFLRSASFFLFAAIAISACLWDGNLQLWECILIVSLYIVYVVMIVAFSGPSHDDDGHDEHPTITEHDVVERGEAAVGNPAEDPRVRWLLPGNSNDDPVSATRSRHLMSRRNSVAGPSPLPSMAGAFELQTAVKAFRRPRNYNDTASASRPWGRRYSQPVQCTQTPAEGSQSRPTLKRRVTDKDPKTAPIDRSGPFWTALPTKRNLPFASWSTMDLDVPMPKNVPEETASLTPPPSTPAEGRPRAPTVRFAEGPVPSTSTGLAVSTSDRHVATTKNLPKLEIPATPSTIGSHSYGSDESLSPGESLVEEHDPSQPLIAGTGPSNGSAGDKDGKQNIPSWWPRFMPEPMELAYAFVPTLVEWKNYETIWAKFHAVIAVPSMLMVFMTTPTQIVEPFEDDEKARSDTEPTNGSVGQYGSLGAETSPPNEDSDCSPSNSTLWNRPMTNNEFGRWVLVIWCLTSPQFTLLSIWLQSDNSFSWLFRPSLICLGISAVLIPIVFFTSTSSRAPPIYRIVIGVAGFIVSVAWISIIADQVVGSLKALAIILNISDEIMGLTVFAMAASLQDFVANTAIAKMGFPIMAFAACFGGPMLNIMLGIGFSGIYVLARAAQKHTGMTSFDFNITPTLMVSAITLLITLLGMLIAVPLNGWMMDRKIGICLIALWCVSTAVNVVLELTGVHF